MAQLPQPPAPQPASIFPPPLTRAQVHALMLPESPLWSLLVFPPVAELWEVARPVHRNDPANPSAHCRHSRLFSR